MYTVEKMNGEVLAKGNLLDELLELVVFKHIEEIEKNTNVLTRLDKGYYKYLNQLSCIFKLSKEYAMTLEIDWNYIELILDIYNQEAYISNEDFIQIKEVEIND
ncbi:hypothetical protein L2U01_13260 [Staphylococcus aureus]|jgi:hypothetical protein|uniref:hypothetical protein n=1 Tax=Staphylococcus capitis TaxID=29388 RepID=UPI00064A78EE|nr:hypothetical protein [Staphylococcus capitis]AKL93511.1 hypothetical protein AYP1020_p56 [Staphylococcus capitis subsp. capitis]MCS4970770.1 hypothetical protein [Staphylococcus aureus]